jgi:hypothetical protein
MDLGIKPILFFLSLYNQECKDVNIYRTLNLKRFNITAGISRYYQDPRLDKYIAIEKTFKLTTYSLSIGNQYGNYIGLGLIKQIK